MLIINMKGGLGNQLFQYATGRALSLRQQQKGYTPEKIRLDITGYSAHNGIDTMRIYSLSPFNICADIATPTEIRKLKYPYGNISKAWRLFRAKILRRFYTSFHPKIYDFMGDLYLDGFFQTEKYFNDKEIEIRRDLTLKNPLSVQAKKISNEIESISNSISIHIRRGDYVSDAKTSQHHGTCDAEYYNKAIEYMTEKLGSNIHLFVFSDDIEWAKINMRLEYPITYVSSLEIPDYEELILMSECDHNIIANSSFSWWGAWLNENQNKIVVAPKHWVLKGERNFRNIVPSSWIRI